MPIPPDTTVGAVTLTVADLSRQQAFYERVIGLRTIERDDHTVRMGAGGSAALVELVGCPDAPRAPRRATGLFHLAILVPSRRDLAQSLRLMTEQRWPLSGASDHLVSEALYLNDAEGNGLEIYHDRPREQWSYAGGSVQMATLPLDLESLEGEQPGHSGSSDGIGAGARIGHVHLRVADLALAERFYHGVLGFDVTVRTYPGALFFSAGGYHHHLGLNTWASEGAPPSPPGSAGLRWFKIVLPGPEALEDALQRARSAGVGAERRQGAALLLDPSRNGVLLTASEAM